MLRLAIAAVMLSGLSACAASQAPHKPALRPSARQPAPTKPPEPPPPAPAEAAEPIASPPSAASQPEQTVLPDRVDAGEISRASLTVVLSGGVGRFLQRIGAEPHLEAGHFVGWRLVRLFDGGSPEHDSVLRPGDTVMRVNGQSIERPEQFKNVWDSIATSSDLVLQVQRGGKQSDVRYRIVD